MEKSDTGRLGELAAAKLLLHEGLEILAKNYRTRFGEIDIIARDDRFIVFAEVKTRAQGSMLLPREAVTASKQRRIILAAEEYLTRGGADLQPRFDVVEVTTEPGKRFHVLQTNHIVNAFGCR